MASTTTPTLCTPAWRLHGITGSEPGVLELADGRLAYTTEEGRVFDAPLAEVGDIVFPWYYFSGGVKLTVAGTRYRLSFVRPNSAADVPARLLAGNRYGGALGAAGNAIALAAAGQKVVDVVEGRAAGNAWKAALGRRGDRPR